jgi:hypothetical protein
LKREIWKEQIKPKGRKIQNVAKVMAFLKFEVNKYHAAHMNTQNKFFHEVRVRDIDRSKSFECETVKGNKAKHKVWSLSPKDPTLCQYH